MIGGGRFGTRDIARARKFYDPIAEMLGASPMMERADLVVYKGPQGAAFVLGKPFEGEAAPGNGNQLTIAAESRAMVDAVHARALALGGTDAGAPGIRGTDPDGFYAAYFRDPDGNKWVIYRMGPA